MHEAFEVYSLVKLTEQIETIAAFEENLLVGTRQGHLIMYLVAPSNDASKYKLQILRYNKAFSKKPITQIDVVPGASLLVLLTDNIILIHDLNIINFPLLQTMNETKGATLFAIDHKITKTYTGENILVVRLAVVVKRRIQLYAWKHSMFQKLCDDIVISDIPKTMAWGQNVIYVGYKEEYVLYGLGGETKGQFLTSSPRSMDPCITKISDTSFMLGRNQSSIIVDEAIPDMPSESIMKINEPLIAGVYDNPYVLGLISDQIVIHTLEPPTFIQTLADMNRARLIYKCRRGLHYVASISQIWRLDAVNITKQRQTLLKDKKFEIAIKLTNMSDESAEEKNQKINSIQMLYALELFDNKKYSESMRIFRQLDTNPADVIKLFPELSANSPDNKTDVDQPLTKTQDPDLENRLSALIEYLRGLRLLVDKNPQRDQLFEMIDTTLLKCYLQTNDAFIGPLLRLNNCKLEEAEKVLLQHKKYSELIILYQTNGLHMKALRFMKEQATQSDSSLKGFHRTRNYLQQLGPDHLNLIFEFSNWVLAEYPEEGLKIFTDDIFTVESLPRAKILDFLLREHKPLVQPYLEHIIFTWKDTSSLFHNALIRSYREKIMGVTESASDAEVEMCKSKLLSFLKSSEHYAPEMVMVHFPSDRFFEERAIALGKLESHELALALYIYIIGDTQRAISYCDKVIETSKDNKKSQDIHIILIRLLINPLKDITLSGPPPVTNHVIPIHFKPDISTALMLLEKHADKIDPIKILSVLPDSINMSQLKTFLEISVQRQLITRRKKQILKGLLYAENLQVQELKMIHESQSVIVNDYDICTVCKKRFGNQSAFVRYPNGDIVHYSCQDKK